MVNNSGILIVDDDPNAIHVLRQALEEYRDVRFATNGADAWRLAQERTPGLVLLDGHMPGEDGFSVCKRFKADAELRDVPIIFVTAKDDIAFETQALLLGAADFLGKPVIPPRVKLRVKLHLELKHRMEELRAQATTDDLTKLPNRRISSESLSREWGRAIRSSQPLSLMMIDVDCFKQFNDEYGHPAGDQVLRRVAEILSATMRRSSDVACRYGGEEFVALLPDTTEEGARMLATRLRDAVASAAIPHRASKVAPHVTVSVGVSCFRSPREDHRTSTKTAADLVEAADRALYLAKRRGRNRVECVAFEASVNGSQKQEAPSSTGGDARAET